MKSFALIAFLVIVLIAAPIAGIWALNTLFPVLAIPYNFWTWLAMAVVQSSLTAKVK